MDDCVFMHIHATPVLCSIFNETCSSWENENLQTLKEEQVIYA